VDEKTKEEGVTMAKKYTKHCIYCGGLIADEQISCGNCREKLKLIRKLQKMLRSAKKGGAKK
jgi:predicted nucleic acid-binding Zn ribbon protein